MITPTYGNMMGFNPTGDFGPFTIYTAKNRKPIFYIKKPPTAPPTARQAFVRERLKDIAIWWASQTKDNKALWERVSKKARLRMCGYALFQWWHWHHDDAKMATIQQQSGLTLPGL